MGDRILIRDGESGAECTVYVNSVDLTVYKFPDQSGSGLDAVQDDANKRPSIEPLSELEIYLAKKAHAFLSTTGGEPLRTPAPSERILREVVREILEAARDKGYRLVKDE